MRTTVAHEWQSSANAGVGYWTVITAETQSSSATVRLYLTLHGQRAPVKSPRPAELQKKTDLSQERDANAACGSRSVDEESLTALVLLVHITEYVGSEHSAETVLQCQPRSAACAAHPSRGTGRRTSSNRRGRVICRSPGIGLR
jgi:hypothetical protein